MSEFEQILAPLRAHLAKAIEEGDAREESIARVNIACAFLQGESPESKNAFEEALASVRRAQNKRSEGILSMFFAPYFVKIGDPARALELAERGEKLLRRGRKGHRVLANLQLASVLYGGFADPSQAGAAIDRALAELAKGEVKNATDQQVILQIAGPLALAATEVGDVDRAIGLARIVSPEVADELEKQRPQTATGLSEAHRQRIGELYGRWQIRFGSAASDPHTADSARAIADSFAWNDAKARRSGHSGDVPAICEFVERVHRTGVGGLPKQQAIHAGAGSLTDDDIAFVLSLGREEGIKDLMYSALLFELAGEAATDPAFKGRCLRVAGAIGHEGRDPRELLGIYQRALSVLEDGVDDPLRAEVVNEVAVCQLNMNNPGPALEAANLAAVLARQCGQDGLERMARGNVANVLLRQQRVAEALGVFESLARDQEQAGEFDMAHVSHQNIQICRNYLQQHGR